MRRALALLICWTLLPGTSVSGRETNPVRSGLEAKEAWMGQGVPFVVTLISPGPFSGTARFQLPEIPGTLIVKQGNPMVGSETVNGESMMTQRHEFSIYTQQVPRASGPEKAIEHYRHALKLKLPRKDHAEIRKRLAETLLKLGDVGGAKRELLRALRSRPTLKGVQRLCARLGIEAAAL